MTSSRLLRWVGCTQGIAVELRSILGGGHFCPETRGSRRIRNRCFRVPSRRHTGPPGRHIGALGLLCHPSSSVADQARWAAHIAGLCATAPPLAELDNCSRSVRLRCRTSSVLSWPMPSSCSLPDRVGILIIAACVVANECVRRQRCSTAFEPDGDIPKRPLPYAAVRFSRFTDPEPLPSSGLPRWPISRL